jgi:hypothetical protein
MPNQLIGLQYNEGSIPSGLLLLYVKMLADVAVLCTTRNILSFVSLTKYNYSFCKKRPSRKNLQLKKVVNNPIKKMLIYCDFDKYSLTLSNKN